MRRLIKNKITKSHLQLYLTLHRILRIILQLCIKHMNSAECVHRSAQLHQRLSESQDCGAGRNHETERQKLFQ